MMENPLELPAPDDALKRVTSFALDLAYGISIGLWNSRFNVTHAAGGNVYWSVWELSDGGVQKFNEYLVKKWMSRPPSVHLLLSLNYLEEQEHEIYLLSSKSFNLLEKPATPPSVFISYKQDQSSDLALLVEARLKLVDRNINIFIDKLLQPGDDWEKRLEETVRNSRYFICLLTSDSLMSKAIQDEIQWAHEANCTMIAICHNGYDINEQYPPQLRGKQAIIIRHKNAKEYESAINDLLNGMGYSTI